MIAATPTSVFQQTFELTDPDGSGEPFGEIALRMFGGGRLTVGDADFDLEPRDLMRTTTALVQGAATLAVARRPNPFLRRTEVTVWAEAIGLSTGVGLELVPEGWFGRRWTILADGLDAGTARWTGALRPALRADLSEALPLAVQAFVVAVLVLQRRREGRSN